METHELHTAELDVGATHIALRIQCEDGSGSTALSGSLGSIPGASSSVPRGAEPDVRKTDTSVRFAWPGFGSLTVEHQPLETDGQTGHKYRVTWELEVNGKNTTLADAFRLEGCHWYGGAQMRSNQWPVEKLSQRQVAYVTADSYKGDVWGGVQERYWLNSKGAAIFVDEDVPLFVSLNQNNDQSLCFISKWNSPYKNVANKNLFMRYTIYQGSDVRDCHDHVVRHVFSKPSGIPDELMFRQPIWSTWARYKKNVNHDTIIKVGVTNEGSSAGTTPTNGRNVVSRRVGHLVQASV